MTAPRSPRQHCAPILVSTLDDGRTLTSLDRVPFVRGEGDGHSEGWLQTLINDYPDLLPMAEIEPGFGPLTSICMEFPTPAGPVDNLFLTPEGNIVVVECKLWRNPEARREVVAQIMDYAQAMSDWSYQDLQDAVRRARPEMASLFDSVATDLDEAAFVDAVTRNLSLGRVLLVILGDGIREGAEQLTQMLQAHAGFHFTLALAEMPVFHLPDDGFIVVPRILARTVMIERGIVTVVGAPQGVRIESSPETTARSQGMSRKTISVDQGLEALSSKAPDARRCLDNLMAMLGDRPIQLDANEKSLQLNWYGPNDLSNSLGYTTLDGIFVTDNIGWNTNIEVELAHAFLEDLAKLIGGKVRQTPTPRYWNVRAANGRPPETSDILADPAAFLTAVDRFIDALTATARESEA